MQTAEEVGTLWLVQPEDIQAHLAYAAREIRDLRLTGPGLDVVGVFLSPRERQVRFRPSGDQSGGWPKPGTTLCAEYAGGGDTYRFFSRLAGYTPEGDWLLDAPLSVERQDRRLVLRMCPPVLGGYVFRVTDWRHRPELPIHDVSVGGVGFYLDESEGRVSRGDLLDGVLELGEDCALRVCIEVRHVARVHDLEGMALIGARITAITTVDRELLADHVARMRAASGDSGR